MRLRFDHFDAIASWYDRLAGPGEPDSALTAQLAAEAGHWLLDVGGGTGRHTAGLVTRGIRVAVCDLSLQMARQAAGKGLRAVVASAERLPFPSDAIERVLVVDAFHHFTLPHGVRTQSHAASELLRVLTPGGRLVIQEPDIRRWPVRLIALTETALLMRSRFISPPGMVRLFSKLGAQPVASHEMGASAQVVLTK
jgi:demethylmenaquinone methyltransferase/2-methoxy-6-polyprenyl-1,4-benzoquinol methylase